MLPRANLDDEDTFFFEEDIHADDFITDVSDCIASRLLLCADAACASLLDIPAITFTENPTSKKALPGEPTTTISIDRRNSSLFEEFFIMGQTLDPAVNAAYNILVAVCGEELPFAAEDVGGVLETKLLKPDAVATVKTVSLLDLFTFASPQVFPTESCLESFTICNTTVCGLDSRYLDQFTIDGYDLLIRQDVPMAPVEAFVGT